MKALKLGVIGVGHLGSIHARLAAAIADVDLVGVYDTDPRVCECVAQECSTKACNQMDDLLNMVDAVSIVVPTVHHFEVAEKALQQGKHVFLEKPITATVAQAEKLINLAESRNLKVQVGHIERFNPALLALKDRPLDPMFIECHRLSTFNPRGTDVSVVLDLMIHDLDIVLSMIKSPLLKIDACGVKVVSASEDIANVRLKFENGSVVNMTTSRISVNSMRKMRLFQKNMYVSIDFLKKRSEVFTLASDQSAPMGFPVAAIGTGDQKRQIYFEQPQAPEVNALEMELQEFALAVLRGENTPVTGQDGMRALEVATTILEQIEHPQAS